MKTGNESLLGGKMLKLVALKEIERQHGIVAFETSTIAFLEQDGQIFVGGCFARLGAVNGRLARMGPCSVASPQQPAPAQLRPRCPRPAPSAVSHQTAHLTDASGKNSVCSESGSATKP